MAQCAAFASVPISVLKQAKSLGCPAFKHGRVYFAEFLPWLFTTMMTDSTVNWGEESKKLDVLLKRVELAEKEKRVIDRGSVADGIAKAQSTLFSELDRVFVSELPARGKGMDEVKLQILSRSEIEKLKETLGSQLQKLTEGTTNEN